MNSDCAQCEGTGWRPVERDGVRSMEVCLCRRRKPDAQPLSPHFVSVEELLRSKAGLDILLNPIDRLIGKMIEQHRGAAQAIPIREIAARVWPELAADPREIPNLQRRVKISVEKLRTLAGMAIASSKTEPAGYFIPGTAKEADEYADRMFREGIKLLKIARLFNPQREWMQEARGQMKLQEVGSGK